ncbi:ABC transporter substrate-binding protein [Streptomyces sp. NBC_01186]|uniref:hypothetical protein n=1 Tax=Streptomyces sp. NBC_01186 TaxID=2903765 RepID=UPI002E0E8EED|nr:ABC transporter substrate-binding protein [Streptomyces sp. NBC_01186]
MSTSPRLRNPSLSGRESTGSPLAAPEELTAYGELSATAPHTEAELATVLRLLSGAETVTVGRGRDGASRTAAEAFATAWQARGGTVLATVDWPETAASWLRPARRLTAPSPDAWVLAAAPRGFIQLARRLHHSTPWDPTRTVAFASLGDSRLPAPAGPRTLNGLSGATSEGHPWHFQGPWLREGSPSRGTGRGNGRAGG